MGRCKTLLYTALFAFTPSYAAAAGLLDQAVDGWHTWQIDEAGVSSQMCCYSWRNGETERKGCSLEGTHRGFSGDCDSIAGTVQVYVKVTDGVPDDIRVLSSNCPVSSESEVADHGLISGSDNLDWFKQIIEDADNSDDLRENALFGLVQSGGDAAFEYLDRLISGR